MRSIIMIFTSKRSLESSSCFRSFSEKSKLNTLDRSEIQLWDKVRVPWRRCRDSPCGSWMRWMAEKLKTSAFLFFLCFYKKGVETTAQPGRTWMWQWEPVVVLLQSYLQDFHRLLQLLLVLGGLLACGVSHLQVPNCRPLLLKVKTRS